ncbi:MULTISPECIES: hypothetical protein [Streptomyces]|uniref:hypothetical protein n=1 Tax=Streptomyces TaxID=1883 RepID=UPI0015FF3248|nr:hypothetical protein [Streptomyces murinus]MBA9045824.1 hypothetical protein [Streptomyces murinus]
MLDALVRASFMPSLPLPQRLRPHGGRQPTGGAVVDWELVRRLLDLRDEEGMPFPGGYQAQRGRQEEGRRVRILRRRPEQTLATSGGLGSLHRWNSVGHPLNPETVDIVAKDDTQKQRTDTAVQANEWLGEAATSAFGKGTEITGSSVEEVGKRLKVTAETNRGGIAGW